MFLLCDEDNINIADNNFPTRPKTYTDFSKIAEECDDEANDMINSSISFFCDEITQLDDYVVTKIKADSSEK